MLENNTAIPLYAQLKEKIISDINNETLKYGDKIETEQEIMKKYNLSRITVRRAISELVAEGYLVKKQGKGTFVIKNKIERKIINTSDSLKIMSFTKELKENNIKASSKIIELKIIPGIEEFNQKLGLTKNSKLIFMKRVRYANDSPMTIEENYFSYDKFKGLLEEKIEGSLYELLEKKYNVIPTRSSRQEIEIVKSDEEQSKLLNVPTFEPLFYFSGVTYDENDIPIHIAKRYIIGSKYKFIV
ncbi:GntR family transcriptional regulator [uncultured Fusobacterium sp.]|uniref:GntR family transcriptional regulator n=1 Tax=uncultured Fusobacterium sp. TaxID=159267 RepID=UPI0015A5AE7E|nr:GntR family transcriptional regulator [uncultured Fusobacterium sp.]